MKINLLLVCILFILISCLSKQKPTSIEFEKLGLTCIHSDKKHVVFKGKTSINGLFLQVLNEVNYNEVGERVKFIQGKDTLSVYLDENYYKNFIYDVNLDGEVDLNFLYKTTKNTFVNYSFSYDPTFKKYKQIPDTIYYKDLKFFESN
ncbi:MAG: hypothetical protein ACKOXP_09215 [Flavobacteriales bacterium]